ncbi:MAG: hypothetical protein PHT16_02795 [Candidatus Pacebacteria bacterium]|nr:hypothetical protein [Candidatus Paceibacterota bacterium]
MKNHILSKFVSKKQIKNAVSASSKIEGIRFARAQKNNLIIKKLQKYGRAFSL